MEQPFASRSHEQMREVLMDPQASGPAIHYYMIRGGTTKQNITVMEPGLVGGEYIKTYGHYHVIDFKETYKVIHGQGMLILQTRKRDGGGKPIDDDILSFEPIEIHSGDSITIPPFAGHILINTGETWLVTSDDSPVANIGDSASMPRHADYEAVKKMHGFAYYVIQDNGQPKLVKNTNYKFL